MMRWSIMGDLGITVLTEEGQKKEKTDPTVSREHTSTAQDKRVCCVGKPRTGIMSTMGLLTPKISSTGQVFVN